MNYITKNHRKFGVKLANINRRSAGMVVRFMYDGEMKHAIILDAKYEGKMHAIKLDDNLSESDLERLLSGIGEGDDYDRLVSSYMSSPFTLDRAYRTYIINKMRSVERIFLKE